MNLTTFWSRSVTIFRFYCFPFLLTARCERKLPLLRANIKKKVIISNFTTADWMKWSECILWLLMVIVRRSPIRSRRWRIVEMTLSGIRIVFISAGIPSVVGVGMRSRARIICLFWIRCTVRWCTSIRRTAMWWRWFTAPENTTQESTTTTTTTTGSTTSTATPSSATTSTTTTPTGRWCHNESKQ